MAHKVSGLSTRGSQFQEQNERLFEESAEIGIALNIIELDNWLRVIVEVGEDITHEQLREVIPIALQCRERLLEYQGPWLSGGKNHFLESLNRLHTRGNSYREIAVRVNSKIMQYLHDYLNYKEETTRLIPELKPQFDEDIHFNAFVLGLDESVNQFAISHAVGMLEGFRLSNSEIDAFLNLGIENIKRGDKPFLDEQPVSRQMVIDKLRHWRNSKKRQAYQELDDEDRVEDS